MGTKKGAQQLQIPVNTDEEWDLMLETEGLVVVDVYSGWSGPCIAMVGALRKFKMEEGGDLLSYAIAKNDEITALERFRGSCEPTWMFIGSGHLITVMFGADAPKLIRLIRHELDRETEAVHGDISRIFVPFDQLTETEAVRARVAAEIKRLEDERKQAELDRKLAEAHAKKISNMTEGLHETTMIIYLPFLYDAEEKVLPIHNEIKEKLVEMAVVDKTKIQVPIDENLLDLVFQGNVPEFSEETAAIFETDKAFVIMVVAPPAPHVEGEEEEPPDLLQAVAAAVYYAPPPEEDEPPEKSVAEKYITEEGLIGVWTPTTLDAKFAAFETYFPDFANTFEEPPPPPIPPHVAVAFDASRYFELHDTIVENTLMIMDIGFFTTIDPATAVNVAKSIKQYVRMPKTGTEKMIFKINTTKDESLLNFGQFKPLYVSYTPEIGEHDCAVLFPPREKVELEEDEEPPLPPWLDLDEAKEEEEGEEGAEGEEAGTGERPAGEEQEGGEPTGEGAPAEEGVPEGEAVPAGEGAPVGEGAPTEGAPAGEGAPPGEGAPAEGAPPAKAPSAEGAPAKAPSAEGAPPAKAPSAEGAPAAKAPSAEAAPPVETVPEEPAPE